MLLKKYNPPLSDIFGVMNKTKPYDKITLGSFEPKVDKDQGMQTKQGWMNQKISLDLQSGISVKPLSLDILRKISEREFFDLEA